MRDANGPGGNDRGLRAPLPTDLSLNSSLTYFL